MNFLSGFEYEPTLDCAAMIEKTKKREQEGNVKESAEENVNMMIMILLQGDSVPRIIERFKDAKPVGKSACGVPIR